MNLNTSILTLIDSLHKGYNARLSALAHEEGLSILEGAIISFLKCNTGYDEPHQIVALLKLRKGNVSTAVQVLEKKGYLIVRRDPKDKRKSHLLLTEKADPLVKKILAMRQDFLSSLTKGLSEEEIASFAASIEKISENLAHE
jgi:DNA-binding MarR family transcriptional regulator